jgi:lactonase
MSKLSIVAIAALGVIAVAAPTFQAQAGQQAPALAYTEDLRAPAPIPQSEKGLQTITAEPWFKVSDKGLQLEGASFDRDNNLIFVEVFGGSIFRLSPDMKLTTIMPSNDRASAGLGIHKDGRIFVAVMGDFVSTGTVVSIKPDGSDMQVVVPKTDGYLVDDLIFDKSGGFYFSDFRGEANDPAGGVYYVSPDFKKITPVLSHVAIANGVGLSPDGKTLWVTSTAQGLLYRVELADPTTIAPFGAAITYHFTGFGPDSLRVDADGNVYVAMYSQGRVLVFNPAGYPIGQILIPGRETGHNLRSTSMAFKPGTNDLYIVTNDWDQGEGSQIFHAKGFGKSLQMYSQQ